MAMFSKPKGPPAAPPARCERCGEHPPTVRLHMVRPLDSPEQAPSALWLCARCLEELKREAGDN